MFVRRNGNIAWHQFDGLSSNRDLTHAASTRLGGRSQGCYAALNVSYAVGDDPSAVLANRESLCAALGIRSSCVVCPRQVHGSRVARVGAADRGRGYADPVTAIPATDGLVTDEPGVVLWLTFADCVPILLYDPFRRAVGLLHAGWKGTAASIAAVGIEAMLREFGSAPDDIRAAIGPAIGPCCYRVGTEVAEQFADLFTAEEGVVLRDPEGEPRLDLVGANAQILVRSGVRPDNVEVSGLCTSCRNDLFYSHRAERGHTGRFAVVAGLRGHAPG